MIPNIINAYPLSRSTKSAWNGNGCYDEGTIDNMLCRSKWLLDHETLNPVLTVSVCGTTKNKLKQQSKLSLLLHLRKERYQT